MDFLEKLRKKWDEKKFVSVGLDPEIEKIPDVLKKKFGTDKILFEFNKSIIDTTSDFVAAFKPNSAFYEGYGLDGIGQLKQTTEYIKKNYPDIVVILDAKRADIGNTNNGYVKYAFDFLEADAITVHPYMGGESLEPFLSRKDKGVFVLCRTSNPGANEFQDLETNSMTLYEKVAFNASHQWNSNNNCGLVVGATYPTELSKIRGIAPTIPLLIPGVGFQGGDLENIVKAANKNFLVSSSRGILYASDGSDFIDKARDEVKNIHNTICSVRDGVI